MLETGQLDFCSRRYPVHGVSREAVIAPPFTAGSASRDWHSQPSSRGLTGTWLQPLESSPLNPTEPPGAEARTRSPVNRARIVNNGADSPALKGGPLTASRKPAEAGGTLELENQSGSLRGVGRVSNRFHRESRRSHPASQPPNCGSPGGRVLAGRVV